MGIHKAHKNVYYRFVVSLIYAVTKRYDMELNHEVIADRLYKENNRTAHS